MNKVIHGKALESLLLLENDSVDLTVTSPPYNVNLGHNKYKHQGYDTYADNLPHCIYIDWLRDIFTLLYTKTKPGGRCVINIGDGSNGRIATHAHLINVMQQIGWNSFATIIWDKSQVGNRVAWGSFNSPSCPSFPTPFEYILVFYKEFKKLQWKGISMLEKQDFIDWSLSIWRFPGVKSWHPAPFPEELPKRCIQLLAWKHSLIIDPFMGSGTTLKVAHSLGCQYWGCDISAAYVNKVQKEFDENN